jgi:hypothetical protein
VTRPSGHGWSSTPRSGAASRQRDGLGHRQGGD